MGTFYQLKNLPPFFEALILRKVEDFLCFFLCSAIADVHEKLVVTM